MKLILYSKPGCHLCEGLQQKLEQIRSLNFELEIRDITTREDWFLTYQYEVPVLYGVRSVTGQVAIEELLPRLSPRVTVEHLQRMLQRHFAKDRAQ